MSGECKKGSFAYATDQTEAQYCQTGNKEGAAYMCTPGTDNSAYHDLCDDGADTSSWANSCEAGTVIAVIASNCAVGTVPNSNLACITGSGGGTP